MQTYTISNQKTNSGTIPMNDAMAKFIDNLMANKKSLFIETAELIGTEFHVSYCHEYLSTTDPDWMDTRIAKSDLVKYMVENKLNQWESVSVSFGEIINTPHEQYAETRLLEMMPEEQYYIIREYLESLNK